MTQVVEKRHDFIFTWNKIGEARNTATASWGTESWILWKHQVPAWEFRLPWLPQIPWEHGAPKELVSWPKQTSCLGQKPHRGSGVRKVTQIQALSWQLQPWPSFLQTHFPLLWKQDSKIKQKNKILSSQLCSTGITASTTGPPPWWGNLFYGIKAYRKIVFSTKASIMLTRPDFKDKNCGLFPPIINSVFRAFT